MRMKNHFRKLISLVLFAVLFVNCTSTKNEAALEGKTSGIKKHEEGFLIKWKDEYYFVEGKEKMEEVLKPFPKSARIQKTFCCNVCGFIFSIKDPYEQTDVIYQVKNKDIKTDKAYIRMNRKEHNYKYGNNIMIMYDLPDEKDVDIIFSKLQRVEQKKFKSDDYEKIRKFITDGLEDDKIVAFYFLESKMNIPMNGYYKLYIPASSKEEIKGLRIYEIQKELHELYAKDLNRKYGSKFDSGNSIVIDSLPINYIEETHEIELTAHGPIEVYERINKYRKGEFHPLNVTVDYFEKED